MLFFVKVRVKHEGMSLEELWSLWETEAEAALGAKKAGKVKALYKVVGQRRVMAIADVESHDPRNSSWITKVCTTSSRT